MRRWTWRIFVTLSAALFVGTVALWVRSQSACDYVHCRVWRGASHDRPSHTLIATTFRQGPVFYLRSAEFVLEPDDATTAAAFIRDRSAEPRWARYAFPARDYVAATGSDFDAFQTWSGGGGFTWQLGVRDKLRPLRWGERVGGSPYWYSRLSERTLAVPWWAPTVLFALTPLAATWGWVRRRRQRPAHLCRDCGYDLRATPDERGPTLTLCPECGRIVQSAR